MPDTRVVFVGGGGELLTSQAVLDKLGLKDGQNVTWDQESRIIDLNAIQLMADIRARSAAGEKGLPDTAKLEEELKKGM